MRVCVRVRVRACARVCVHLYGGSQSERVMALVELSTVDLATDVLLKLHDTPFLEGGREHPARHDISRGMALSRTARYPTWHGIPHGTVSHSGMVSRPAWYHARHGRLHSMVP